MRRRAVIAATTGTCAGIIGLVLLGVGAAAASTGPSPGPAAGPTPVAPATTVADTAVVDMGLPPVPSTVTAVTVATPTVVVPDADEVAQQGPVPVAGQQTEAEVASLAPLPTTGQRPNRLVLLAWITVLSGGALVALRTVPRRERSPRRLRR